MPKEIIFGISEKNIYDDVEYVLYVTYKDIWDKENCCTDQFDNNFHVFMESNGFHEIDEGVFEHQDGLHASGLYSLAEKMGLIYNEDFENFMNDNIDGDLI